MGALCCPWQLEFQSNQPNQPKNLMQPFPYLKFDTPRDIYFFENVNRQRQQTINILIIIPHLSLQLR